MENQYPGYRYSLSITTSPPAFYTQTLNKSVCRFVDGELTTDSSPYFPSMGKHEKPTRLTISIYPCKTREK